MKICFYNLNLNNPLINAAFGGMYESFWKAIEAKDNIVTFSDSPEFLNGDILIVPLGGLQEQKAAKAMARFKGPVVIYVPPAYSWFYKSFLKRWRKKILFAYGTDSSNLSFKKYNELHIPYYHLPFASDETIFKPLPIPKIYDIIFIGNANSGIGRYRYTNLLMKTAKNKNWKVLLIGSGWEKYGYPFQMIAHGELLNIIYNTGKICLNIHNDIQYLGQEYQMDANNRSFDLAMAGCFQICNANNLITNYFEKDEIVAIDDPNQWVGKIDYYLMNESEMINISQKAREKALSVHTWHNRADAFLSMIDENQPQYVKVNQQVNLYLQYRRLVDQYIFPLYKIKKIRILNKILKFK
jgi:spore maturation protein CgeB